MDIQDLKMAITNASPTTKAVVGAGAAGLAGAGLGGLIGGWKGAGLGGALAAGAGAAGASTIPEAGWWKKLNYKDHNLKTKVLGENAANFIQENPVKSASGVFAATLLAQLGLHKMATLYGFSRAGRPFTGMRPGQTLIP
jgi:hypothetical protein